MISGMYQIMSLTRRPAEACHLPSFRCASVLAGGAWWPFNSLLALLRQALIACLLQACCTCTVVVAPAGTSWGHHDETCTGPVTYVWLQAKHPYLQPGSAKRSRKALALHLEGAPAAFELMLHLCCQPLQAGGRRPLDGCNLGCNAGITGAGMASTASGLNDAQAARHRGLAQDTHAAWSSTLPLQGHKADLHMFLQLVVARVQGSCTGQ